MVIDIQTRVRSVWTDTFSAHIKIDFPCHFVSEIAGGIKDTSIISGVREEEKASRQYRMRYIEIVARSSCT